MNVDKLKELCENSKFYEVQQMFIVLYNKNLKQEKFDKCAQILLSGINKLFKYKQLPLIIDLGKYLIQLFNKMNINSNFIFQIKDDKITSLDLLKHVIDIFHQLDQNNTTPKEDLQRMINLLEKAISWSSSANKQSSSSQNGEFAEPILHVELAKLLFRLNNYEESNKNFLRALTFSNEESYAKDFSEMLYEWSLKGNDSEMDLFLVRACLQLLALKRVEMARIVFTTFSEKVKKLAGNENTKLNFIETPLCHYCKFLFISIEKENLDLFKVLLGKYEQELTRRDASLREVYVDKIGHLFFNLPKLQKKSGGNNFGSMISSIFQSMMK
ncbi:hypothetical protein ABK040_013499 [Willaertia magna]